MQLSPTAESAVRSTSKPDRGFGDLLRDLESDAGALGPSPSPSPDPTVERSAPRASSGGSQSAPTSAQGEKPATTSGQDVKQGKPAASGESGKPAAGDSQPAQSADKAQPVREAGQGGAGKTSGETGAQTNTKLTVKAGATAAGQAATATTTAA